MKAIKLITLAVAACVALCFTACTKTGTEPEVGTYTCTVDVTVSAYEGAGIVFFAMRDAVIDASRGFNVRTPENDSIVLAAADAAAKEHGDDSNKLMSVAVVFQPGNVMGEAEKEPIVLRRYTFVPVD
jgi:hypothetical protein